LHHRQSPHRNAFLMARKMTQLRSLGRLSVG
jgi:hypothetical protein